MEGLLCANSLDLEVAAATRAFNCAIRSVVAFEPAGGAAGVGDGAAGALFASRFLISSAFALAAATAALMSDFPPACEGVVGRGEPLLLRDLLLTASSSSG